MRSNRNSAKPESAVVREALSVVGGARKGHLSQEHRSVMVVKAVAVVGAGHVGVPHAITLALKCPSIRVTIVDTDKRKVAAWKCVAAGLPNPRLFCCQSCC